MKKILYTMMGVGMLFAATSCEEEFYKLKYCSTVVYMVPRA